jgi:hypothetical protein
MGRNNQRLRAASRRSRRQRGPMAALRGPQPLDSEGFPFRFGTDPEEIDELASMQVHQSLVAAWEHGWQPLDLLHRVRRSHARLVPLLATAIGAEARSARAEERAPQPWLDQLLAVADEAWSSDGDVARLARAAVGHGARLDDACTDLVLLVALLTTLPVLEQLTPPPSAWGRPSTRSRPEDGASERGRLLSRIRTLLAKAENTEFAAEAETFTAKAQDLMTRHAIDEALLHGSADQPIEVKGVRVHISNPYPAEKVQLLSQVARANRSRAVWNPSLGLATVIGTPTDVDQVEMLFTSLLIQATRAMAEAGARRVGTRTQQGGTTPLGPPAFQRSSSFRRSFLMSYAVRIGERLTETNEAATASYGAALVPLLQRQTTAVQEELDRLFPRTRSARAGRYNRLGWDAGRAAADRAVFAVGRLAR